MTRVEVRRATGEDAAAVADVWLASFSDALPTVRRAHDDDDVRRWIREHLVPSTECWVAVEAADGAEGRVVGMMALAPGWVEQLYVHPAYQGRGVGSALLAVALERDEPLQLWTFQVNTRARAFYARHGFREVELTDGATNEEREPDVRMLRG